MNTEEIVSCEGFTLDPYVWLDGVSTHDAVALFSSMSPAGVVVSVDRPCILCVYQKFRAFPPDFAFNYVCCLVLC